MRQSANQKQQAREDARTTIAFGYTNSRVSSLRLQPGFRPGTRVAHPPTLIVTALAVIAALAQPQVRSGLVAEAWRATFAGFAIFGGALFLMCSVPFAIAYTAAWTVFGVVRHVIQKMEEGARRQQAFAAYEI